MNVWLSEIWRAWRASVRRPGFLMLATGVLALGIGASVAVATLIGNTLWRPLPVPQPEQLVVFGQLHDNGHPGGISPHEYQYLEQLDGVTSLGLERPGSTVNVAGAGTPAQVPVIYIDRNMLPTLGLSPVLGRNFDAQEDRPSGPPAVILGHGFWQRSYAGDTHVIGRSLRVEGVPRTIVGVLPAGFNTVLGAGDVVLPTALPQASRDYNHNGTVAIARLARGADLAAVSAQVDARERAMNRDMGMGGNWQKPRFGAEGLAATVQQDARPMLLLFLASALLLLLIALVNLTNLMLLRALSRNHDAAVRSALGASLPRLMLPALGEGLLVGGVGALLGMVFAVAGLVLLQGFIPAEWLWGGQLRIGMAAWVSAFGVGLLGALLAAVLALWRSRSATTVDELREGGRSGVGLRSGRLGHTLVVAQVALAAVLLCAAGVFMHGLYDASQLRLGFADDHVLTFELAPVKADYRDVAAINVLTQRLVQRLQAIPGVTDAAVTTNLPASNDLYGQLQTNPHTPDGKEFVAQYHGIGPGFLKLFSIPLREGRDFRLADAAGNERVVIVSQDLADTYYGGHAVGKMIDVPREGDGVWPLRIVGVVGATYQRGPLQPLQPVLYIPLAQMPDPSMTIIRDMEPLRFALRGNGNPMDWQAGVREALAQVAPQQPIANLRDMRGIVRQTTQNARLSLWLIGLFAALALLLAAAGLYAVMAVAVAAREREFGVRMALGAAPRRLLGLVLRGGLIQIVAGLVIGVAVALGASHAVAVLLMTLLGRSNAFDPMVVLGVCAVLAAAGLLACLLPALRAGRVHPIRALRGE
ncbi:FtsX-like permease family protein [Rhodanobacter glycinis]|uniref:FtsX-like permease family protein n=1 Tax=Rhodanobacter glycinis TaxID=582702 RepID=A0A502CGN9_9GAMM|nr:ADOP family duplicated permease [Rhodanobacter glycinis]TPG11764.1 FtsX-like permease family protein [Rhodanobacter glycinis]